MISISTQEKNRNLKWIASIGAIGLLFFMGFQNYPQLLGAWESFTFYKTFGALDPGLSFRISPRANLAYEGYALLEIGRYVTDVIGWSFTSFRLPVIIYGLISLAIFFVCSKRWFGFWPALGATVLLGLNPLFLVYQHQMNVVMVTFMLLLFVFERLQNLEVNPRDYISWATLGIASAFCALHYGPGRHLMIYLIGLFSIMLLVVDWYVNKIDRSALYRRLVGLIIFFVSFLVCLMIMNPLNIWDIMHLKSFVFPYNSEASLTWTEIQKSFGVNIPVVLESLTGWREGMYHSKFSTDVLIDSRYPLLPFIPFLFFMMGICVCLMKPRDKHYFVIHFFLLSAIVPMTFSSIVYDPFDGSAASTLSSHRLFYALIPIYMYIAAGVKRVSEVPFFKNRVLICWVLTGLILFSAGLQIVSFEGEKKRFNNLIQMVIFNQSKMPLSNEMFLTLFKDSGTVIDRPVRTYHRYYADQLQYLPTVHQVTEIAYDKASHDNENVLLIPISLKRFHSDTYMPYYRELNFHTSYLSFYLSDLGVNTGFIQVLSPELRSSWLLFGAHWLFGGSRGRQYSAEIKMIDGQPHYVESISRRTGDLNDVRTQSFLTKFRVFIEDYLTVSTDKFGYRLRQTQRKFPRVIITTTSEEMDAAKSILTHMSKRFYVLEPL